MKIAYRQRPKNGDLKKGLKIRDAVYLQSHWRKRRKASTSMHLDSLDAC